MPMHTRAGRTQYRRAAVAALAVVGGCASAAHTPASAAGRQPTTAPMVVAVPPATQPVKLAAMATTQPMTQHLRPAVAGPATLPITPPTTPPTVHAKTKAPPPAPVVTDAPLAPAKPPTDPDELAADAALAARVSAIAQSTLPAKVPNNQLWNPIWQSISAMLAASMKLDPASARYARLAADAAARADDQPALLADLLAAHSEAPNDQFTTIRVIDVYLSRMQTASEKLAYLKQQLGNSLQPAPVRAHAGVLAAQLLLERDEPDSANNVLAESLRLNPSSGEGLRMRYALLPRNASVYERATDLLAILRANPAQPTYTTQLGDLLSAVGLSHEAIPWYQLTLSLTAAAGRPDLRVAQDCTAELLLADQVPDAVGLVQQLVTADPGNVANWMLKLAVMHGNVSNADYQSALQQAINVAGNAVVEAAAAVTATPGQKPTTRPIETAGAYPLPDLQPAVDRLQATQSGAAASQPRERLESALANYATVELLYAHDPGAAASVVGTLTKLLPAENPVLQRLQGWTELENGNTAAARQHLSAAAGTDPLAALGLLKLQGTATPAAQPAGAAPAAAPSPEAASQLLSAHPGQLIGALLFDQLRDTGAHAALSSQAQAVQALADQFPMNWLSVMSQPQNFYVIEVEPVDVARSYGQPLMATLTIQNVGDFDLTIGPDGVLQRGVVFSAAVQGIESKQFPAVAYDELASPLVLPARQSTSQTIRLDQGPLAKYLDQDPSVAMTIHGTAMTNPAPAPKGMLRPAACGYAVDFGRVFGRVAAPLGSPEAAKARQNLIQGTPQQKLDALQLLAREVQQIVSDNQADPNARGQVPLLVEAIRKAQSDRSPAVAAWASYVNLLVSPQAQRVETVQQLVQSPDWRSRLLGLMGLPVMEPDEQLKAAQPLVQDPEPSVRALARARVAYLKVAMEQKK